MKKEDITKMSVAFGEGERKLFRAEFESYPTFAGTKAEEKKTIRLRFLSFGHINISSIIEEVTCSSDQGESRTTEETKMNKHEMNDEELPVLRVFDASSHIPFPGPFLLKFRVKLRCTISSVINKLVDSAWSQQLWASSCNKKMTDVEFLVGEETFGAHRSLLSARSPVFAAMFASGMKEAVDGQVRIEDVNPTTFQLFLKFLYTGMFEPSSTDNRELFAVADKYGVETLMELCRPTVNIENIIDILLML